MRRSLLALAAVPLVGVAATLVLTGAVPVGDSPAAPTPVTATPGASGSTATVEAGDAGGTATATATEAPVRDTDGDGLVDGVERDRYGTDPTSADTDGDGLPDSREIETDADPAVADTDDDGLLDGRELYLGTNATRADSDGDDLPDGREIELGTNASAADSDGDGLGDSRELDLGTNATSADTDDDGLADGRELELGGDPLVADTDDDSLPDGRERDLGTNPTSADTDGDGLPDGAEAASVTDGGVRLPDSDPGGMDLYVQVTVGENAEPFDEGELDDFEDAWAAMPVDNPDGSTGVDLHVDQGRLDESVTVSDDRDYLALGERSDEFLGNRSGVYYSVVLAEVDAEFAGRAPAPGAFSVVATRYHTEFNGTSYRTSVAVHELLHNVAGRLDEGNRCPSEFDGEPADYHACEGWLSYDDPADSQFLPDGVAAELGRDGLLRDSESETARSRRGGRVRRHSYLPRVRTAGHGGPAGQPRRAGAGLLPLLWVPDAPAGPARVPRALSGL